MHGGVVTKSLPSRPNLDHLRRQAKVLLQSLHDGDVSAARTFIKHLPAARKMNSDAVRAAGFRLADAQSVIARQTGFGSWPLLARHVQQLRALEGEWQFAALNIDGRAVPAAMLGHSRLLIDGDRFRTESPEGIYEGIFTIDVAASPSHIDIEFVEGPEAGNWSHGIYELDGDRLTMCLGLTGASRPSSFATAPGSGHALERLRRSSAERPARVSGGARKRSTVKEPSVTDADASAFDGPPTPTLERLQGEWIPTHLVQGGQVMSDQWLAFGSRTMIGNEVKVVFGGQVMVHAKVRIHEQTTPMAIDYLNLKDHTISQGLIEWIGDEVRIIMGTPGASRPGTFDARRGGTLSQWRRRA
jgi:uncharacterized protein (TIGR03067 family)